LIQRNTSSSAVRRGKSAPGARRGGSGGRAAPAKAGRGAASGDRRDALPALGFESEAATAGRIGWREAVTRTVTGLGYDLIDVEREARGLLRVTIDRRPGQVYATGESEFVLVEDCETVTRQLQYALEVDGVDYARLEVSSPGLDRPLRSRRDFERFAGQEISLTLKLPFNGRKNWRGLLALAEPAEGAATGADAESAVAAAAGSEAPGAADHEPGIDPGDQTGRQSSWTLHWREGKTEQVLTFTLDEVREARLVPVLDFKGRRSRQHDEAAAPPQGEPTDAAGVNGGQGS
jgi:ribosome maturation factor RimP